MSTRGICVAIAVMLTAGCASGPDRSGAAQTEPVQGSDAVAAAIATPTSLEVLTEDDLPSPGSQITCREMLKQGSNVIVRTCMSNDDWKRYERRLAAEAAAIVRTLQGGRYR